MIKAEIMKGGRTYVLTFKDGTPEDMNKAWKHAYKVATGEEQHQAADGILDLGTRKEYDHIKVWHEAPVVEEPKLEEGRPAGMPSWDEIALKATYLGQELILSVQEHIDRDQVAYYVPMFLEGDPALDRLSSDKLLDVTKRALEGISVDHTSENVVILIPPAALPDWDEARDYIKDYVKETEKPYVAKDKNARAWIDWNEIEKKRGGD